jgi:membrane associated rhomboid family serine protease
MNRRAALPAISFHHSAHQLAIAMIAMSVINGLLGGIVLLFIPTAIISNFELWRPFTGLLVAIHPMEIIFGALIIYSIGGSLEDSWGKKRFLAVALGIPFISELLTLALFILMPTSYPLAYHGASMIISTIWIAYGLRAAFSRQLLNFWGSPLKGETFALIGLGFVVLSAVFSGVMVVLPDLIAAGLTYLYMYKRRVFNFSETRRRVELAYYNWKLRRLKSKSGFRVVKGSKDDSDPSTRYH